MSTEASEAAVINGLLPQLQAEGYEVFVHPRGPLVPTFLGSYNPDVIALREDRNLAIEVAQPHRNVETKLRDIAALFEGRDDWEFRIVWVATGDQQKSLARQSIAEIADKLAEVDSLIGGSHFDAAFLLSWAVLEALGRSVLEEQFRSPQTPGRLVQVLASEGVLSPREADALRPLIDLRNRLIHGELDVGVLEKDARTIALLLHSIVETTKH
jgi:uncharacterized protein YutE (UPF0331/DUF86 family)